MASKENVIDRIQASKTIKKPKKPIWWCPSKENLLRVG